MTRRIDFRHAALLDVEETVEHLEKSDPRLALRFQKAVRQATELVARFPSLGRVLDNQNSVLDGTRFVTLRRFRNHVLYYQPTEDGIIVLRVLRGSRDLERLE